MTRLNRNQQGVIHHVILPLASVVLVVGVTFVVVQHANHHATKANLDASHSSSTKSKLTSTDSSKTTATTAGTTTTAAPATNDKMTTTPAKTSTGGSTPASPAPTPAPAPAPAPTTLSTLTAIISSLKAGGDGARITTASIEVSGPISTAHARPIVFSLNGQIYYAYRQGTAPNFDGSASDTANSMAITTGSSSVATGSAHLNKSNQLVDADSLGTNVGYSTGGN